MNDNDMEIDSYFDYVNNTADLCFKSDRQPLEYVEEEISTDESKIKEIVRFRGGILSEQDRERLAGYLEIGYFENFHPNERMALFSFVFDISSALESRSLECRFEEYKEGHPLFNYDKTLFSCIRKKNNHRSDFELLDSKSLNCVNGSEVFERKGRYYKLDSYLNPAIYSFTASSFPAANLFIRLDPYISYNHEPPTLLNESTLIPANPKWWSQLNIHLRKKEGASYFIEESIQVSDSLEEYWDYHVNVVRRLDIIAKRNGNGNLSMMLEELCSIRGDSNITIGRCIHLDTDSPYESDFFSAKLNHLDLAINVYDNSASKSRIQENLANGNKVTNATFRTHLLRVEGIPMPALLPYAILFFKSKYLVREWTHDQFTKNSNS